MMEPFSDKQLDAYENSNAKINIFEGPVRAGKSFIALIRWIRFCIEGPKGELILSGVTDRTIKRNIILPLQDLIGSPVQYFSGKGEVHLYNRIMYVIGANDARSEGKIRGSTFAGALIDEGTLIPETFFKMLSSRLSLTGSQMFVTTNPDSPFHWLKRDYIDRVKTINASVFSFNIHDNPSLSEKYINDLKKEYQGLWHKRYILGEWVVAEGAVYDFFNEDIHIIDNPPGVADYYIVGVDYGTTNPCVFTLIGYSGATYPNIWLEKEYYYDYRKHLRQKSDYEYSRDLEKFMDGYNIRSIYIDPSAASFKAELQRNGVKGVVDAKNEVIPGIRFVGQLISSGTFKVCNTCQESIKEFSTYLWDSKASEKGFDKPIKANDHCLDSIRYALYTHFFNKNLYGGMTEKDADKLEEMYR